jgi:hypothetical protein
MLNVTCDELLLALTADLVETVSTTAAASLRLTKIGSPACRLCLYRAAAESTGWGVYRLVFLALDHSAADLCPAIVFALGSEGLAAEA